MSTVVLAYSGGLDTSVAIRWIKEKYGLDVIALTIDVGNERDLTAIAERAKKIGAVKSIVVDGRSDFVNYFVWPALKAGAIYEGQYPLATALARPLIGRLLVEVARTEGSVAVAHGCTGKGNDQVRFDVSINTLAPDLKIIAPVREWSMTRDNEIAYAAEHNIPIPVTNASPYSVDQNLWGRSIECGILEDPWAEPPEEVYAWTANPDTLEQKEPEYVEITFHEGIPLSLNGEEMDGALLVETLNKQAGAYGIGRIDHIEDRLVGIKSREIYEAPAAVVLHAAHKALETLTLSREQIRFKELVVPEYSRLIYNGQWYSGLHQDLATYVQSTQRFVSGTVRMKLSRGHCAIVGRKSENSLYSHSLATYETGDQFDHNAALGFIKLWGLPMTTQAQAQLLPSIGVEGNLLNNHNSKIQIAQQSEK
ncbi:argininosuccinate synthase [Ktedonosporobacter rubrisoli]|uniref:Argininosuccinate synthase n=1 Tax=Ktedonosporobacter rubrisoli TaxID=2509675 RepID=A0A4V0YZA8_KTERU|nr:argininosuccinate synthase [Ktedonosporobacter rubrisoli]QBD79071.1 argininosuccinate synthase [Ktedonosporobacter rubrisoli]